MNGLSAVLSIGLIAMGTYLISNMGHHRGLIQARNLIVATASLVIAYYAVSGVSIYIILTPYILLFYTSLGSMARQICLLIVAALHTLTIVCAVLVGKEAIIVLWYLLGLLLLIPAFIMGIYHIVLDLIYGHRNSRRPLLVSLAAVILPVVELVIVAFARPRNLPPM